MKPNIDEIGIIDEVNNPFGKKKNDWKKQACGLTDYRRNQLMQLLNRNADEVLKHKPEKQSRYPAFVAVRWGFAILLGEGENKKIIKTKLLDNYNSYDRWGRKII
ncbi:MAG: hypothetical protein Q8R96_10755 [Bacteroidota bacterium]|nr:hypothetical protein [Bacteroidota bacterium]